MTCLLLLPFIPTGLRTSHLTAGSEEVTGLTLGSPLEFDEGPSEGS